MKSFLFVLFCLLLWSCQPDTGQQNETDAVPQELPKTSISEKVESEPQPETVIAPVADSAVEKAALSFHRWYLEHINNYESEVPTDAFVVEGQEGKCKLEMEPYFDELRKLGTISQVFIEGEKERLAPCAAEMAQTDWTAYKEGQVCDMLTYFYWINSQETMEFVEAEKSEVKDDSATVWMRFYDVFKDTKNYWPAYRIKANLALEDSSWRITKMEFL